MAQQNAVAPMAIDAQRGPVAGLHKQRDEIQSSQVAEVSELLDRYKMARAEAQHEEFLFNQELEQKKKDLEEVRARVNAAVIP